MKFSIVLDTPLQSLYSYTIKDPAISYLLPTATLEDNILGYEAGDFSYILRISANDPDLPDFCDFNGNILRFEAFSNIYANSYTFEYLV